jgi:hypothetical protein
MSRGAGPLATNCQPRAGQDLELAVLVAARDAAVDRDREVGGAERPASGQAAIARWISPWVAPASSSARTIAASATSSTL